MLQHTSLKSVSLAALLMLAACAPGNVSLSHVHVDGVYGAGEFSYAGAGRDLRVDVAGNPFGGDQAAFGRKVTDSMQGRHWGPRTNFTTTPGPDARDAYRVVMLFEPPGSLNGAGLCEIAPSALPTEPGQDGLSLFGAFCRGEKVMTRIKGRVSGAAGPDDPVLRELVGQVTTGLFPPERSRNRSSRCRIPLSC